MIGCLDEGFAADFCWNGMKGIFFPFHLVLGHDDRPDTIGFLGHLFPSFSCNNREFPSSACMLELGTYLFLSIGAGGNHTGHIATQHFFTLFSAFGSYFPFLPLFFSPSYLRNAYSTV